jgi:hypothetical protein
VSITNSTIAGNIAGAHTPNSELYNDPGYFRGGDGGGAYADLSRGGSVAIANTTISGNTARSGFIRYYLGSELLPNRGNGGGVASLYATPILAENSTISGNHADAQSGAISAQQRPGGPFYDAFSTGIVLVSSTVTENTSGAGAAAIGGDGFVPRMITSLTAPGGARPFANDDERAEHRGSQRRRGATAVSSPADVADPLNPVEGQLTLIASIVAGNGEIDITEFGSDAPLTVASTHSIIGTLGTGANLSDQGGTQLITTAGSLLLGPLAANGGPTLTHALLTGSPAIDTGGTSLPAFTGDQFDQRGAGFARIIGGFVDVGAYEYEPVESEPVAPKFTG